MANSRSSSRCSSVASYGQRPPSLSDPPPPPTVMGLDPNDGRGDEIQPCPIGFHPMAHTPPPPIYATQEQLREEHRQQQMLPPKPAKERRLPSRSGSTASLFSPFASLTRRLGAKHKSSKTSASSSRSTGHGSRMSTPVEFPAGSQQYQGAVISRSVTPASVYSTFPRIHSSSSSNTPSPSGRTPFISQLLGLNGANGGVRGACVGGGGGSSSSSSATVPATTSCPSCPSPGPSYSSSSRLSSSGGYPPMMMTEVLDEPVEEEGAAGERVTWEYHHVTMNRVPGYGFGIAVSGGRDNPHFANGDPSIAISDVIKGGPAEGKLLINDRVMSVNGVSLENVDYGTAVSVLRDSGAAVNLVVKRRIVLGAYPEPTTYKVTLTKSKKKDDFGVILGSRIYLKELTNRALIDRDGSHGNNSPVFQEGDIVLKINSTSTDGLSLKEARKLMENCKDKLQLTVRRDAAAPALLGAVGGSAGPAAMGPAGGSQASNGYNDPTYGAVKDSSVPAAGSANSGAAHFANYADRPNYCNQNLYVQPPTRGGSVDYRNPLTPQPALPHSAGPGPYNADDKSNLSRLAGRSRGPLMDVSLSQLDHHNNHMNGHADGEDAPPRPPPPRSDDYYSPRRANEVAEPIKPPPTLDPRFISFQKEGSVGIRVTGGNQVGIFVTAVQPGSPAALQGLVPGDKILKVNDMEMNGVTREEAVLFLLSLQDQIELVVQHKREEYDQVVASGHGDSFYVKTHFNYEQPASGHMAFRKGEVFHVVDTLYKGVVGAWQAFRVGPNGQDLQQGVVPNGAGAEELATAQFNAAKKEAATTTSESRGSFFRRRRPTHRRSKSLGRDHWDDVVFAETLSKFPAYERVVLRHPGFIRPVVFFGPVADVARDKLIKDFPDKFSAPQMDGNRDSNEGSATGAQVTAGRSGIVRLSAIRELVEKGRHALLDITPGAVDKLNYAQFYPVVIFLRADSKHTVKELRAGIPKTAHKSSKKLYEQCVKLEKLWTHVFTTTVPLTQRDTWYRKLREAIDREQNQAIWVSEAKLDEYLSDDFLFPMTSRLSYASSPESDLDLSPEPRASGASAGAEGSSKSNGMNGGSKSPPSPSSGGRMVKSSSDPSIATQDDLGVSGMSSPAGLLKSVGPPGKFQSPINSQCVVDSSTPTKRRSQGGDSKYGFSSPGNGHHPGQRDANTPRNYGGQPANYSYNSPSSRGQQASTNLDYMNGPPQSNHRPSGNGAYPTSSSSSQQHHLTPYSKYGGGGSNSSGGHGPSSSGVVELPPKIDRSSKPTRLARSAQERLFGSREGDVNGLDIDTYPTSPPGPAPGQPGQNGGGAHQSHDYLSSMQGSSLDRDRAAKAGSYDSSSSYESYNRLGLTLALAGSSHQSGGGDVNAMPGSPTSAALKSHDPYRYTRSTSQPVRSPTELTSPATKQLHRPFDHKKQSPPPKSAPYKPVPPPKPKNYRPPANASSTTSNNQQPMTPNSNYWNHSPPGTLNHPSRSAAGGGDAPPPPPSSSNGGGGSSSNHHGYYSHAPPPTNAASAIPNGLNSYRYEDDTNGGFDSAGHGSSLDRHSYGANSLYGKAPPPPPPVNGSSRNNEAGQYYYNIPPPRESNQKQQSQSRDGGRLDLAQHRDQRGSAFELYKKPADPRSPGHGHQPLYMEHNARLDYEYYDGDGFSSSPYDYYHNYHHHDYYSPPTSPPPPNCSVIATVRGWLTHDQGGRLESVETGVALLVPPRALPPGPAAHLVYFKVCRQDHVRSVDTNGVLLDDGKGEALLSPLVQCGPKGLRFLQPVELRIPHDGGSRAHSSGRWNVSLKTSNELGQWRQIELPQRGDDDHQQRPQIQSEQSDDAKKSRNHLSVFVDHF
ncbi:tight junction protein ZO-1 isoform X3 [Daphnia magna]|uniref:tight junction protein ZO-1 isoform X3 n=1 Tax=Daphnia magna TaxID=35525 RepID=UPI001E1BBC64|nr:tight junction protein ZO-1 isoform X3 [Daphnia magna]